MKYVIGLIGLLVIFAIYTSLMLVRYSYVQAAYMQYQHDVMMCLTTNEGTPCATAMESGDKFRAIQKAIGQAPAFYKLFVPKVAL